MREARRFTHRPRALFAAALAALLAGCSGDTGNRTRSAGTEYPLQAIAAADSALAIGGPADHKHQARQIGGRYQETISFANGAAVAYEQLVGVRMVFGVTGGDLIRHWYDGDRVKQAGFVYKDPPIRRSAESFSLTATGTNRTCALYGRVFGQGAGVGDGDQLDLVVYCLPSGPDAAARTEHAVEDIVARLKDTPLIARPLPKLSPTPG